MNALMRSAAILMMLGLIGCGGKSAPEETKPSVDLNQERPVVLAGGFDEFTEPRSFTKNVGLHARVAGDTIYISMLNRSSSKVQLLYTDLAIITGPNRQDLVQIHAGNADIRSFIPIQLEAGQRGVTHLKVRTDQSLRGMRLVYNNPRQDIQTYVDIQ